MGAGGLVWGDYADIGPVLTCHRVRVTVAGEKVLETRMEKAQAWC